MSQPNIPTDNPILEAWQQQLAHASQNPFLLNLLLKQWQRVLKRLAYFYAQLAALPRRKRRALQRALATSLIGAAMLLAMSSAPIVYAAPITVSGACTLDEAITNANNDAATFPDCAAGSGADTITLTADVTLVAALPDITSEITLEGANFFVSGANMFRVFRVTSSGDFTINDTTVKEGNAVGSNGAGIYNYGGTATLNNSTVSGNTASRGGGGIYNYRGTTTLNNSTVSGNTASLDGGGINNHRGTTTLNNSTVSGNSASSDGGGIYNFRGTTTLNNSTVSGNSASDGGGIYNDYGTLTLNNSTVSGNSASDDGGGIVDYQATLTLQRTLISGNTATNIGDEIYHYNGSITANAFNLFGHSGETNAQALYGFTPGATDITATSNGTMPTALASILDPMLALNGNPNGTLTHALVTGSPALDKAPNAACTAPPINDVDQRGFPRNVDFVPPPTANDCDIGAFELQLTTAVNVTALRAKINDAGNVALKWRTTTETQIAGFNVYRRNGQGEWKQINANFKQSKHSGDAQGDKYRYVDKKVDAGKTYRYKIEVKYLDGHTEWTEVVKVTTP